MANNCMSCCKASVLVQQRLCLYDGSALSCPPSDLDKFVACGRCWLFLCVARCACPCPIIGHQLLVHEARVVVWMNRPTLREATLHPLLFSFWNGSFYVHVMWTFDGGGWWCFLDLSPYSKYYKKDSRLKLLSFHMELLLKGKINALQYTECSADSYQVNLPMTKL